MEGSGDERQVVSILYKPRDLQADLHRSLEAHRWSVIVIHRRFGKTYMLLNHLIKAALTTKKDHARFVYIAPFLKQAKTLAWDYLKRFCETIPGVIFSESELKVSLPNGSQIRLFGADNPDALRGIYCDGAVLDEYAQCDPLIFTSILRPALSDRRGWCVFSGTPNGRNHFYDMLMHGKQTEGWFTTILKASETGIVPEEELADARRTMTEEEYDREYECSFDSIIGKKIYPEYSSHIHVATMGLKPDHPTTIYRGWDNTGLHPAIVLSYLTETGQWRIFQEFWFEDCGSMEAAETIITWCNIHLHPQCNFIDYADPAGKNRDGTKMSNRDYITMKAREMGKEIYLIDGIQTWKVRRESVGRKLSSLRNGEPALLVDPACPLTIEGFSGGYAYQEYANLPGMYKEEPVKNKYKDIHDAIQYMATRMFAYADDPQSFERPSEFIEDYPDLYHEPLEGASSVTGY